MYVAFHFIHNFSSRKSLSFSCLKLDVLFSDISVLNLVGRLKSYMVNFHWQSRPLKLWS